MSTDSSLPIDGLFLSAAAASPAPAKKKSKHKANHGHKSNAPQGTDGQDPDGYDPNDYGDEDSNPTQTKAKGARAPAATEEYDPQQPWQSGVDWPIVAWIVMVHLGACLALFPYFFSWEAVIFTVVTTWISASWGICMGYHRLLTHGSFQTYRPIRWALALLGSLTGEGSALTWVSNHRLHHQFSDKEGDPHSPRHGNIWSHMLWFMPNQGRKWKNDLYQRFSPDLYRDPVMRALDKLFLPIHWLVGTGIFFGAYAIYGDWQMASSFVVWGVFVRMLYTLHITWFVNSATHLWGYTNYETSDDSKNLWWVGLAAFGEGWHNNHHAYQRMAKHGHRWWEIDVTYWAILGMEKVGLAWNVVKTPPKHGKPA